MERESKMSKKIFYLLPLFLTSCLLRSPNAEFYNLNSDNIEAISDKKTDITVNSVKVPDILQRPQLVVYDNKNKTEILEFQRWNEFFPDVIQTAVVRNLSAYFPKSHIAKSYFASDLTKYNLKIEVTDFEAYKNDKVILKAWWKMTDNNNKVIFKQHSDITIKVAGKSIDNIVIAQSTAIRDLSLSIAEHINNN